MSKRRKTRRAGGKAAAAPDDATRGEDLSLPVGAPAAGGVRRADWLCVVLLLLVTLGFFWKGLADPVSIVREDAAYVSQPYYQFADDELKAGRFPHWNPYSACGMPYHASLQGALLYPLRWPLLLMSYPTGYVASLIVHYFLTAAFMFMLCRVTLGCGRAASLIGAMSFALGGTTHGHVTHWNYLLSYPWLVLTVFLVVEAIRRRSWACAVGAGIPLGLMGLIGSVHLMLILGFGLGVIVVGESIVRLAARMRGKQGPWADVVQPVGVLAVAIVLAGLISMAQMWPSQLQSGLTVRANVSYEFITEMSAHPARDLLRLVVPFYYGTYQLDYWGEDNFHEHAFYPGVGVLVAALAAVVLCWRNRWVPRLTVFAVVLFLVAAGRFLPVYKLLYSIVPGFGSLRNPVRFMIWVQFAVACLAAIGVQGALAAAGRKDKPVRAVPLVVAAVMLTVIGGSLLRLHSYAHDAEARRQAVRSVPGLKPALLARHEQALGTMTSRVFERGDAATWAAVVLGAASACAAGVTLALRGRAVRVLAWCLPVLVAGNLAALSLGHLHYSKHLHMIRGTPPHVQYLKDHLGLQRYVSFGGQEEETDRHKGMLFRIRHAAGGPGGIFHTREQSMVVSMLLQGGRRVMALTGVKYLVSLKPLNGPGITPVFDANERCVSQVAGPFPLAFLTRQAVGLPDPNLAAGVLWAGRLNLREIAVVDQSKGQPAFKPLRPATSGPDRSAVSNIQTVPGRYSIDVQAEGPRQLVLTVAWHPQWRCRIDGEPATIHRTDFAFMSVRVEPGEHKVEWTYEPVRFRQGLVGSAAGAVLAVGFLIWNALRRRGAKGADESNRGSGDRKHVWKEDP
ncbi:MAG TPA: YfhO family protein [Phycisphaerae bacterium]|nr:YfhO family protein [Phycisphaerae bacterium]